MSVVWCFLRRPGRATEDEYIIALNKKEGTLSVAGKLNPSIKSCTFTPRHLQ